MATGSGEKRGKGNRERQERPRSPQEMAMAKLAVALDDMSDAGERVDTYCELVWDTLGGVGSRRAAALVHHWNRRLGQPREDR